MKKIAPLVLTLAFILTVVTSGVAHSPAAPRGEVVLYRAGETECEGYFAIDPAHAGPRPAVLIVHAWKGHDAYVRRRADELAALGYAAFALDMYGKGVRAKDAKEAGQLAGKFYGDRALMRSRFTAGLEALKAQKGVDASRIAAIGYCFGGTVVLEAARSGIDLDAVVSFHGGLSFEGAPEKDSVKAKVLVCNGDADPLVAPDARRKFSDEMTAAGADFVFIEYGHALHAFTDSSYVGDQSSSAARYDEKADARSWRHMLAWFEEAMR